MNSGKTGFTVRVSGSRLAKGLLAIPQKFRELFPSETTQIKVVFDDGNKAEALTFHPFDPIVKETRIFGLRRWFSKRNVQEGDSISITVVDAQSRTYRIALDRFIREREEESVRQRLKSAATDAAAKEDLRELARLTRKRLRQLAEEELLRIAQVTPCRLRPRVPTVVRNRHEGVPAGIRTLLREVHEGKCQICSFTFQNRDGEPYFEIHHLDPDVGHHPSNLLVLCPNCHAEFEHAKTNNFEWLGFWLVGVTINGKRLAVRQPLAHDPVRRSFLGLSVVVAAAKIACLLNCGIS